MGNDPRYSVTDRWGRTHDVPNLFIADSSVFVTGGAAHPTLTLMALAARTAAFMIECFRRREL
jgi:choline dehydrogenase-like flavoprotein